ncbi:hypothetical protein [Porphyrobacter sp. AAP60]|uniref:hypothetical protein n=1 Tax=Porphyrobacter sp. AAP60 TaxID=1523423 RepID=UPI0006B97F73|nr:hypothetical protein [Porphyrobacter sp. AAP60]KPF63863.1 hypothetical protein IP79_08570 [Porphyrobacter sp. AAP60]
MIPLSRRRPRSITIFAIAFFGASLPQFIGGLFDIPGQQAYLQKLFPPFNWSREWVIVWRSAWLSIALIPIAMVWLSAVRFARWMVTVMALLKLGALLMVLPTMLEYRLIKPLVLASTMLDVFAVALLFTPASNRWFAHKGDVDPAVFE